MRSFFESVRDSLDGAHVPAHHLRGLPADKHGLANQVVQVGLLLERRQLRHDLEARRRDRFADDRAHGLRSVVLFVIRRVALTPLCIDSSVYACVCVM